MDNLFLILLLLSLLSIPIGLIKPSLFSKLFKKDMTRKKLTIIFSTTSFVLFFAFGFIVDPVVNVQEEQANKTVNVQDNQIAPKEDDVPNDTQNKPIEKEINEVNDLIVESNPEIDNENINEQPLVIPEEEPANEEIDQPAPQTDRDTTLAILKENAKQDWGEDYEMVKYEYENQVEAYDWVMVQTKYPSIMSNAKQDWGEDYEMVKYEYENQVEAYNSL